MPVPDRSRRRFAARALGAALWAACAAGASPARALSPAPPYPVRPLRIIVMDSPGTANDFFARTIGGELSALYRQRVIVENRAGAGGLIGNTIVSRAEPDGYTLGMVGVTRLITALMHHRPPYQALADVIGVAHVASITNVLVTTPALPVRTAWQLVHHGRGRAGEMNFASLGAGSASHLAGELFSRAVGIAAVHVPFRNLSDAFVEMGLGRVHYAVLTLPSVLAPLAEGRLRALAVMTPVRSPALPHVPSIAEHGLPEAQFDSWSGLVVPNGTPRRIVEQLHGDVVRILRKPALRERFVRHGAESMPDGTPDGFNRLMQAEFLRFQTLISRQPVERS